MAQRFSLSCLHVFAVLAFGLTGCGKSEPAFFRLNLVALRPAQPLEDKQAEEYAEHRQTLANILEAMFGTPDQPVVLKETGLDEKRIQLAAGPVGSEADGTVHGLYRLHCAHCHGISGDGAGPTAPFLNPYPRDYRPGTFKFKSTVRAARPTHADLVHILQEGIAGTAMPSFKLLTQTEQDALAEYVKYLALRGQVELALINEIKGFSSGDKLPETKEYLVDEVLAPKGADWAAPPILEVKPPPKVEHDESVKLGRALFYGAGGKLECSKCHGNTALGDGGQIIYDDWTKKDADLHPGDEQADLAAGGLPRRQMQPRNLRLGVYRGGRRPIDLYRRVMAGINGTPMPEAPKTLTTDEAWHVVDYILELPYEPFSENPQPKALAHYVTTPN